MQKLPWELIYMIEDEIEKLHQERFLLRLKLNRHLRRRTLTLYYLHLYREDGLPVICMNDEGFNGFMNDCRVHRMQLNLTTFPNPMGGIPSMHCFVKVPVIIEVGL